MDRVKDYSRNYCEQRPSIRDFKEHQVFVSIEDFMKHVLNVPDNWKTEWGPIIEHVKINKSFQSHFESYSNRCGIYDSEEEPFCEPLMGMLNAILHVAHKSPSESVESKNPQCYLENDFGNVSSGGLGEADPSSHTGPVHEDSPRCIEQDEVDERGHDKSNLTWAQPIQILKLKPFHGGLVDGSDMPRLMRDGQDPQTEHAEPPEKSSHSDGKSPRGTFSMTRKRSADELSEPEDKVAKRRRISTPDDASSQTKRPTYLSQTSETDRQQDAYIQVAEHLLEQFFFPTFRLHATMGLVDHGRIQFYHANHSVILVSSAISFGVNDESGGLDKLIAIVVAFSHLSLLDNGILRNPHDDTLHQESGNRPTCDLQPGDVRIHEGRKLEFGGDGDTGPFTLTFGKLIFRELSLVGRSTSVLHATSPRWEGLDLVIKFYWPEADNVSECEFLRKATKEAERSPDQWALKHLPRLLFAQDVIFSSNSPHGRVETMFDIDNADFADKWHKYEGRVLRIIVQDYLYRLRSLTNVKDVGQVILDAGCIHRWLYEKVGILHGDLSSRNIMYRIIDGKVYGVLMDFDLSLWTANDHTQTKQLVAGTAPYMAHELLGREGINTTRMYRHDLESLFYVMLMFATRYEVATLDQGSGLRTREDRLEELPFHSWFAEPSGELLSYWKFLFLTTSSPIDLTPGFEDFGHWIHRLRQSFQLGQCAKRDHEVKLMELCWGRKRGRSGDGVVPEFDNETLGGHAPYSALVDPARNLPGVLEGLIVRYESELESPEVAVTNASSP